MAIYYCKIIFCSPGSGNTVFCVIDLDRLCSLGHTGCILYNYCQRDTCVQCIMSLYVWHLLPAQKVERGVTPLQVYFHQRCKLASDPEFLSSV